MCKTSRATRWQNNRCSGEAWQEWAIQTTSTSCPAEEDLQYWIPCKMKKSTGSTEMAKTAWQTSIVGEKRATAIYVRCKRPLTARRCSRPRDIYTTGKICSLHKRYRLVVRDIKQRVYLDVPWQEVTRWRREINRVTWQDAAFYLWAKLIRCGRCGQVNGKVNDRNAILRGVKRNYTPITWRF